MAHYALLDSTNRVIQVITGVDEGTQGIDWEQRYTEITGYRCLRTSYHTHAGVHYQDDGITPSQDQSQALRGNFASVDYQYDPELDVFIPPRPYDSWLLDPKTAQWVPPVPLSSVCTEDHQPGQWQWCESQKTWISRTTKT